IILDIMLPKLGGLEVCRRIRKNNEAVPIVVISCLSDELDKVLLLELGADDYITKPFRLAEVKARIKAVLRRSVRGVPEEPAKAPRLHYGELEIDFERRWVKKQGVEISLTAREFDILALLAASPGRVFSREDIVEEIYGSSVSGYEASVPNHINRIRKKLGDNLDTPEYIRTVRSIGYAFIEPSEVAGS
ncbi:MAG: response regulator transcription factor, partial [Bdellovibrionales bacterium]|nr:response regulator transcription factor [Bdellovibrionales bacterium]